MPLATELKPTLSAIAAVVRNDKMPDLTMRQLTLLMLLAEKPAGERWSVRHLAENMSVHKPSVTRNVERLSKYGFVIQKQDLRDRRCVIISITMSGMNYLRRLAKNAIVN